MVVGQSALFGSGNVCIFCKIINKELESSMLFEDSETIAFLDTKPLFPGHILLIPKKHYPVFTEIPDEIVAKLFKNSKMLAKALQLSMGSEGTFIAVNDRVSQSVPHVHVHVVPRKSKDGLKGFFWPRQKYNSKEEIELVKSKIIKSIENLKETS
jgi:histidine triad (HIT) family protein